MLTRKALTATLKRLKHRGVRNFFTNISNAFSTSFIIETIVTIKLVVAVKIIPTIKIISTIKIIPTIKITLSIIRAKAASIASRSTSTKNATLLQKASYKRRAATTSNKYRDFVFA